MWYSMVWCTTSYHRIKPINQTPFYGLYAGQSALAGTSS